MDTTDAIVAAERDYAALLNDPRRPLSRFVEVSLQYGRMLAEPDPTHAAEVLGLAVDTLHDPPAPAEAGVALDLLTTLRPVAARLGLVDVELDVISRLRRMVDVGMVEAMPGGREELCRRAATVRFSSHQVAEGFAELMDGLRGCGATGLDELATELVLAVRRNNVDSDALDELESMWVELRRQRFDGNWPLWCLTALGALRLDADDVVTAQMYIRRAESILGHVERPVAGVLVGGWVALAAEDFDRAHDRFADVVGARKGDDRMRLLASAGLGESLICLGRPDEARGPLAEAISYEVGDPVTVGRCHELLAELAAADGRFGEAYHHLQFTRRLELVAQGLPVPPIRLATPQALTAESDAAEPTLVDTSGEHDAMETTGAEPVSEPVAPEPVVAEADLTEADLAEADLADVGAAGPDVVDLRDAPSGLQQAAASSASDDSLVTLDDAAHAAAAVVEALRADRLHIHLQEIYDNRAGRFGAAEALLRLDDPRRGMLLPEEFLAPVTDVAVLEQVCAFTIERACEALSRSAATGHDFAIVVNLAALQLTPALPSIVRAALERTGARADLLTVELDGCAAGGVGAMEIAVLNEVRATGARIGIDRFGGEFRSIDALLRLPVDVVKLDRSVFGHVSALSPLDRRMVDTVVALARAFGFEVIAAGIETEAQFDLQLQFGCHGAQGFYIGHPVPEREFRRRLTRVA